MNTVVKRLLSPLLRAFAPIMLLRAGLSTEDLPRPLDAPSVHASGVDPDRVLLLGSGPAMGYGVLSHELALPGHLARQISAATGRGVTVDVVGDGDLTMQSAIKLLGSVNLARYDAVILTVGVNDAIRNTPPRPWRRQVAALAAYVTEHMAANARVFLIGIHPIRTIKAFDNIAGLFPELHGRTLNRETARICVDFPHVTFVPFEPGRETTERYQTSATYAQWAKLLSPPIIDVLQNAPRVESIVSTEESRQRALDALEILDTEPEERFDRIAEFARKFFATESAVISFLDKDRLWMKTGAGFYLLEAPRGSLLVEYVVQQSTTLVVEDARNDDRFTDSLFVAGPPFLRFYAGHPIESWDGERVGVISVFDSRPRSFSNADSRFLRDLAYLVQRELGSGGR